MSTLGLHLIAAGIFVAALVGMSIRSLYRRCVLCNCRGEIRRYPLMQVTLCSPCLLAVELATAGPGEIEREVSTAINTMREP